MHVDLTPDTPSELVRAAWADALESGKYKQTIGQLGRSGGFCCLGVLTCMALDAGFTHEDAFHGGGWGEATPPSAVTDWAGLADESGSFDARDDDGYEHTTSLADKNDTGYTFTAIAAFIREEPEGLTR